MVSSDRVIRVFASKLKVGLFAGFGSVLGGLCVTFILGGFGVVSDTERVLGALVTCIILAGVTRALFLAVSSAPLLVLEQEGVRMEPALYGNRLIPWSNVREVTLRYVRIGFGPLPWAPRYWLRFSVSDAEQFRHGQNVAQVIAAYLWHSGYMLQGVAILNSGLTSAPLDHVYAEMTAHTQVR